MKKIKNYFLGLIIGFIVGYIAQLIFSKDLAISAIIFAFFILIGFTVGLWHDRRSGILSSASSQIVNFIIISIIFVIFLFVIFIFYIILGGKFSIG